MIGNLQPHGSRRQRGFTLVELMVVIAIAAILMAVGIPSFRSFTATQRVKASAFDLATALVLARSEAIKRNRTITIAPAAGGWADGWTVQDTTAAATLLQQANPQGLAIAGPASVVYQANGRILASSSFGVASTSDAAIARCVKVDLLGVPSTANGACS